LDNYKFCVGGAAGCVIAGRLAKADPTLQVLILEAGKNNRDDPFVITPGLFLAHLKSDSQTAHTYVSKPNQYAGGRSHIVRSGGLLGGGSSINFMMYTRASASDYDDWDTEGWTFNDLKPLFKKV
jgi:alcohol oxidase